MRKSRFLVAAPASNAGKTTVSLALMRHFSNSGKIVQPFKCGPDYLDTFLHSKAVEVDSQKKRPGINLDTWLASKPFVKYTYEKYFSHSDMAIAEGVMGLFDGAGKTSGSSAEIAVLLDMPVILVVDAKAVAYSVAPLIWGFKNFWQDVKLAGVIFNRVNSNTHYQYLQEAAFDGGVTPLGYIPENEDIKIKSRHLGLNIDRQSGFDQAIEKAALHLAQYLNLEELEKITSTEVPPQKEYNDSTPEKTSPVIAVARDEAFRFLYHDNLDKLNALGQVIFFSPIHDQNLPACDLLYIAGGYPELNLDLLSNNKSMLQQIYQYGENGGNILAECGGFMYLGRTITNKDGQKFPMAGLFPIETSMENARMHIGYRNLMINGLRVKGHEFHYSHLIGDEHLENIATVTNAKGQPVATGFYRKNNIFGSYMHLYWAEDSSLIEKVLAGL